MSWRRRLRAIGELLAFLRRRGNWALYVIVLLLIVVSLLLILTEGSTVAPFVYPLF
jgi:hypothetical protein